MLARKRSLLVAISFLLLSACGNQDQTPEINLGVVAGPEVTAAQAAQRIAFKNNYDIQLNIKVYGDYTTATRALCEGKIDAAIEFLPYLEQQRADSNLQASLKSLNCQLSLLTHTYIYPMGIYSRTIKDLSQIPQQAVVAVPSPSLSKARALLLLQSAGLIKLRAGVSTFAKIDDIVSNPRQLIIASIDPNQLSQSMAEATLIVVSSVYAAQAGAAVKNALVLESSPNYANAIMVRSADIQNDEFAGLVELYHSNDMIDFINTFAGNGAVPAWSNYEPNTGS